MFGHIDMQFSEDTGRVQSDDASLQHHEAGVACEQAVCRSDTRKYERVFADLSDPAVVAR